MDNALARASGQALLTVRGWTPCLSKRGQAQSPCVRLDRSFNPLGNREVDYMTGGYKVHIARSLFLDFACLITPDY